MSSIHNFIALKNIAITKGCCVLEHLPGAVEDIPDPGDLVQVKLSKHVLGSKGRLALTKRMNFRKKVPNGGGGGGGAFSIQKIMLQIFNL